MKQKYLLTTITALTIATLAGVTTSEQAFADSQNIEISQKSDSTLQVEDAFLSSYNVLRVTLNKAVDTKDTFVALLNIQALKVIESGKVVAFDINIDKFFEQYPTEEERESIINSVVIRQVAYDGSFYEEIAIQNNFFKDTLLNPESYSGELLKTGAIGKVSNILQLNGFKDVFEDVPSGDKLLQSSNRLTTETHSLEFRLNEKYKTGYTFILRDKNGEIAGSTFLPTPMQRLFVFPQNTKFSNQEYTLNIKEDGASKETSLAKFTPVYIF
ncbi:hypothetical protein LI951_12175 [Enterococcus sp. BWT-B8]|uniref:hypothetical protein n=1 Tax=unclassified Enterococcus TaxID=2608891 RepID=UPI001E36A5B2|nr:MULTISPECIES: hypothetical protein [unclassified Enterococcus]MCB5952826.1 hypothetical protein [Enterococcus sp. BWT-B8]MCB5953831.1 hypothetical protein [Enterococcus sp. CWB-B31]